MCSAAIRALSVAALELLVGSCGGEPRSSGVAHAARTVEPNGDDWVAEHVAFARPGDDAPRLRLRLGCTGAARSRISVETEDGRTLQELDAAAWCDGGTREPVLDTSRDYDFDGYRDLSVVIGARSYNGDRRAIFLYEPATGRYRTTDRLRSGFASIEVFPGRKRIGDFEMGDCRARSFTRTEYSWEGGDLRVACQWERWSETGISEDTIRLVSGDPADCSF